MNTRRISQAGPCSRLLCTPLLALAASAALLAAPTASADIGYQFVTVGNPGNANDTVSASDGSGLFFGGVSYTYDIGKYDVTLNQYATFLNAVAQTDPFSLYNPSMATDLNSAGISQTGSSGSCSYSVIGSGLRPVTYVSWFDAARMANWMQNGQPTGLGEVAASTEQGAYTLNGDTTSGSETKNANALYWIPSESEWYKAAYYDLNQGGPGVGGYWTYATRSNTAPGNVVGSGANQANYHYYDGSQYTYSVTQSDSYSSSQNCLTDVGAFTNSASAYGTYDQNGDVWNWNDAVIDSFTRGLRGGTWILSSSELQSSDRYPYGGVAVEDDLIGFRLASSPEPSVAVSMILSGGLLLSRRKRPSAR